MREPPGALAVDFELAAREAERIESEHGEERGYTAAVLAVAQALEEGRYRGRVARAVARVWAEAASRALVRPLPRSDHVRLVAIGGATLGGSGKTPLAIACARTLARCGARVAFVGHAYRARPGRARVVSPMDALAEVGDEAIVAAAALAPEGVPVVVAPSRFRAVALASALADVVVVDGVVQTMPRATLALLAVDVAHPWGRAIALPPCGDLRAPPEALCSASDRVVRVGDDSPDASPVSAGAKVGGALLSWADLAVMQLGLVTALARPDRLVASLARRGVFPRVVVRGADHGRISRRAIEDANPRGVDLWIASEKCALHVPRSSAPLAVISHDLALSDGVARALTAACLDPRRLGQ
jgi:tetraacyldisaccharide 4'-kinase